MVGMIGISALTVDSFTLFMDMGSVKPAVVILKMAGFSG